MAFWLGWVEREGWMGRWICFGLQCVYNFRLTELDYACQAGLKCRGLLSFVAESRCGNAVTAIKRLPSSCPYNFQD